MQVPVVSTEPCHSWQLWPGVTPCNCSAVLLPAKVPHLHSLSVLRPPSAVPSCALRKGA